MKESTTILKKMLDTVLVSDEEKKAIQFACETIEYQKKISLLIDDIFDLGDNRFGISAENPALIHELQEQVEELLVNMQVHLEEPSEHNKMLVNQEYAECLMILFGSAIEHGLFPKDIINTVEAKHILNKQKIYSKSEKKEVVQNVKNKSK